MCIICSGHYKELTWILIDCSDCEYLASFPQIPELKELRCDGCVNLKTIPCLPSLEKLTCNGCKSLTKIPSMPHLEYVECFHCTRLTRIPIGIGKLWCQGCTWLERQNPNFHYNVSYLIKLQRLARKKLKKIKGKTRE